jgi:hypothetical protein
MPFVPQRAYLSSDLLYYLTDTMGRHFFLKSTDPVTPSLLILPEASSLLLITNVTLRLFILCLI